MQDLHDSGCDLLTIGQYMQPSRKHLPVSEYVEPERFKALEEKGRAIGFRGVYAGPLVRSSFNAEGFQPLINNRNI
jgi:lipoic acid synthetase